MVVDPEVAVEENDCGLDWHMVAAMENGTCRGEGSTGRDSGRDETEEERLDRNLSELLQELRVALPGVQVLFAFLLAVPFQQGFEKITSFQKDVYFGTLICTAIAAVMLISPSAYHRVTFRYQQKRRLIFYANRFSIVGLIFLALAMTGAIMLITNVLFGTTATYRRQRPGGALLRLLLVRAAVAAAAQAGGGAGASRRARKRLSSSSSSSRKGSSGAFSRSSSRSASQTSVFSSIGTLNSSPHRVAFGFVGLRAGRATLVSLSAP